MNKLFIAILLLASSLSYGQSKTLLGFKAGATVSTAYMQHSVFPLLMEIGWKPGFTAGIQLTHFPEKYKSRINTAIQFGINYSQKGWIQQFEFTDEPTHSTRINYLEIPLEAVGYFGGKNKYYLSAGFFVEYALSSNVDETPVTATEDVDLEVFNVGISDFYPYRIEQDNRLGYGPRAAAGVFRETGVGVFRLEGFFTFSVRSVFDYEPIDSGIPDLSLNYGFGVTLGYMWSFGKLDI